jgi:Bacterial SH3 domain.
MKRQLVTFLLCGLSLAAQADPALVIRATELKDKPFSDAVTVLPLAEQVRVEVLAREGGWYQVQAEGKRGWVRMTALRLGDGSAAAGDSGVGSALQFLSTGRSGSTGVTVATGVRGLDAADITNAVPNPGAVDSLDRLAVGPDDARRYAAKEKLQAQSIAYLPAAAQKQQNTNPFPWE